MKLYEILYRSQMMSKIFGTLPHCLDYALLDCRTVLDLGCGPSSPLKNIKNIEYSVGVEVFEPYLCESQRQKIHNEYLGVNILELSFDDNSFDAVILIDVLEHLDEQLGHEILKKAERWAKKKIVVNSPNGFVKQSALDDNSFQEHLSGWDYQLMRRLGFDSVGLAGLKFLRHEVEGGSMCKGDPMSSIRFKPKILWFLVTIISQLYTYRFPSHAFSLFSVKILHK